MKLLVIVAVGWTACTLAVAAESESRFQRLLLSEEFHSEGTAVADFDGDGHADIVSGPYWYAGPRFVARHEYTPAAPLAIAGYSKHFFSFTDDFNSDGHLDILAVGMPGQAATWFENPGPKATPEETDWKAHRAFESVGGESPEFVDLTGDGKAELVCVFQGAFGYAEPNRKQPHAPWKFTPVTSNRAYGAFTHGMGVGDVDGDGRSDLLETNGWWQQTAKRGELFRFHEFKFAQSGGAQMYVYDFDGDGDNDVVSVQNAHARGLTWFERRGSGDDVLFVPHPILTANASDNEYGLGISQMHGVALVDIDGDGIKDLVTGKRYWAHGGRDPGAQQLPVLYWFRTVRTAGGVKFEPHLIDRRVGVGTQLTVGDVNGDNRPEIIVGNKLGTFVMLNAGAKDQPRASHSFAAGTELFRSHIRATEPLEAEQERKTFVLPPGFEVQLVASEPDIAKPMNLAFDARGRLWVSSSAEYPYACPDDRKPRDTIKIFEDTNSDGSFDRITTFADELNIPIGLYPYKDGVICFSIPNIWFLRDTDGDGRADKREKLYGPFDTSRDTHGMLNGFTRGFDGWLYACHGFNNRSTVAGSDGHEIHMPSGNTFRMRLDGSRVEIFTNGQVNPFGMTFDRRGDIFTADCHTKPISLLLRGGYHDSFGRPHDGLGYIPQVMDHLHGATGVGGIALGQSAAFPTVYQSSVFGGNVVTSRINRDSLHYTGSTVKAREEPDFLISGDPWFRPVDLQIGPDGALYVADFYNRIIGHYEVKLDHPGRDRHRGRIWRIVYKPTDERRDDPGRARQADPNTSLADKSIEELLEVLDCGNLTRELLAVEHVVDNFGQQAIPRIRSKLPTAKTAQRNHLLWLLFRLDALDSSDLESALKHKDADTRLHAFRLLEATTKPPSGHADWLATGFRDEDPLVRRAAAAAASTHRSDGLVQPLIDLYRRTPSGDAHLQYTVRMALRDHLRNENWFEQLGASIAKENADLIAGICLSLNTASAGDFIVENLERLGVNDRESLSAYLKFAARFASPDKAAVMSKMAQQRFKTDVDFQLELLGSIQQGIEQRGTSAPDPIRRWATELSSRLLGIGSDRSESDGPLGWTYAACPGTPDRGNPWTISRKRNSADGMKATPLYSSFPRGERWTGIYRSDPFELVGTFSFYIAGHDGVPGKPMQGKNLVRLRSAETHEVLFKTAPPRNDTAREVEWDTEKWAGKKGYVELEDGDTNGAYAWLAVGRFSEPRLNPSRKAEDRRRGALLAGKFRLVELRDPLARLLQDSKTDRATGAAIAEALVNMNPNNRLSALAEALSIAGATDSLKQQMIAVIVRRDPAKASELLGQAMKLATGPEQLRMAERLASDADGLELLISHIESGWANPRLLTWPSVKVKLDAVGDQGHQGRVAKLIAQLPDESEQTAALIGQRKQSYRRQLGSAAAGAALYQKQCAACHQVGGKGNQVGPNLDGIGNRGLDRIAEDILAPNRNVDVAFRTTTVITEDGQIISGLVKRKEGAQLVLADKDGKEISIPLKQIEEQKKTNLSLMPANVSETMTDQQFRDLLSYLLTLRK